MAYVLGEQYKQRIDRALGVVEGMPSQGGITRIPTRFETLPQPGGEKQFRVCTFSGEWNKGANKVVTFRNVTATPNTVEATNLFYDLPDNGTTDCAIAKDGTAWYLVQEVHTQVTVITGATLTTAGLEFTRAIVQVVCTATASTVTLTTIDCGTSTATITP